MQNRVLARIKAFFQDPMTVYFNSCYERVCISQTIRKDDNCNCVTVLWPSTSWHYTTPYDNITSKEPANLIYSILTRRPLFEGMKLASNMNVCDQCCGAKIFIFGSGSIFLPGFGSGSSSISSPNCHFEMYYITVVTKEICLSGGRN